MLTNINSYVIFKTLDIKPSKVSKKNSIE